jgi:nicotinamidase-related amidase
MNIDVPEYAVQDEVCVAPERTALMVIDMQNDFVKQGGGLLVPDAESTVPVVRRLLDPARAARMRVVYSQDTHRQGDPEWELWPEHCREGSWGWEIVAELAPEVDDVVLRKVRYDVFYGTPLDHLLRIWGIDTLIICGTVANICVHYTADSARSSDSESSVCCNSAWRRARISLTRRSTRTRASCGKPTVR